MKKNDKLQNFIKNQIFEICKSLGFYVQIDYKGIDWIADVYVNFQGRKYAFNVQLPYLTLDKILEIQNKYIRDDIICCWLCKKKPTNLVTENENLPLFELIIQENDAFVSLTKLHKLPLKDFMIDFLDGKIKFCHYIKPLPSARIIFLKMNCWKCGAENYVYYFAPFETHCGRIFNDEDYMWTSNKLVYNPFIIKKVQEYSKTPEGSYLHLATIKKRFSHSVNDSYMSFGCNKCDSIFGDWYIREAIIDSNEYIEYNDCENSCLYTEIDEYIDCNINHVEETIYSLKLTLSPDIELKQEQPHWCHSGEQGFCE